MSKEKVSQETINEMIKEYENGNTLEKVGNKFGMKGYTVRYHLVRNGVKMRNGKVEENVTVKEVEKNCVSTKEEIMPEENDVKKDAVVVKEEVGKPIEENFMSYKDEDITSVRRIVESDNEKGEWKSSETLVKL